MSVRSEYDDAVDGLVAYAVASAAQLRQLLPAMHPNVARKVARIASQLEVAADLEPSRPTKQPRKDHPAEVADGSDLLTREQVAERYNIAHNTLRYWRQQGTGPKSGRVGRRVMYRITDIEAWIDEQHARPEKKEGGPPYGGISVSP